MDLLRPDQVYRFCLWPQLCGLEDFPVCRSEQPPLVAFAPCPLAGAQALTGQWGTLELWGSSRWFSDSEHWALNCCSRWLPQLTQVRVLATRQQATLPDPAAGFPGSGHHLKWADFSVIPESRESEKQLPPKLEEAKLVWYRFRKTKRECLGSPRRDTYSPRLLQGC